MYGLGITQAGRSENMYAGLIIFISIFVAALVTGFILFKRMNRTEARRYAKIK
jgi:hypothetical protein